MDKITTGLIALAAGIGLLAARGAKKPPRQPADAGGASGMRTPPQGNDIDPGMVILRNDPIDPGMVVRPSFDGDPGMVRRPPTPAEKAENARKAGESEI